MFQQHEWHAAIGAIVASAGSDRLADALVDAVGVAVRHQGTCLMAFHKDARPEVLHHTLEPAGRKHYLERYLAGPYLLDPLYQLALRDSKPSLCRFRDELPDRFRASEYYRQYCERTHLRDEMDFLAEVTERTTVVLVVGRRDRIFTRAELRRLALIEPLVSASMRRIWEYWQEKAGKSAESDSVHEKLTDCFERFGEDVLTDRERQISQLLLRGHSSKAIARQLDIAPGTVMVHKRNLFSKLKISSQYELFSMLIDELGRR
ncbi:MAG TPA: LuxR C-terminal-related transcriptional regulator [Woeseiaceae bacterium]|nr:LuxR C-terminal-related transcriptional regulator [Woeseiaceae bacterium]